MSKPPRYGSRKVTIRLKGGQGGRSQTETVSEDTNKQNAEKKQATDDGGRQAQSGR